MQAPRSRPGRAACKPTRLIHAVIPGREVGRRPTLGNPKFSDHRRGVLPLLCAMAIRSRRRTDPEDRFAKGLACSCCSTATQSRARDVRGAVCADPGVPSGAVGTVPDKPVASPPADPAASNAPWAPTPGVPSGAVGTVPGKPVPSPPADPAASNAPWAPTPGVPSGAVGTVPGKPVPSPPDSELAPCDAPCAASPIGPVKFNGAVEVAAKIRVDGPVPPGVCDGGKNASNEFTARLGRFCRARAAGSSEGLSEPGNVPA